MNTTLKIAKYELSDVVRSRAVLAYALFFLVATDALFRFGGGGTKVLLSLTNIVLLLIPLVSVVYGTMYLYGGRAFVETMLAQPVDRRHLFAGVYAGVAFPLAAAFALGVGLPFAYHGLADAATLRLLGMLLATGVLLTFVFVALAFVVALAVEEKAKGLGLGLLLWLSSAVLYDGLVLLALSAFADYPLEKASLALMLFNPVDLARVLLLLQFDISALMGYTGAVFERFFGSGIGQLVATAALGLWLLLPLWGGLRLFRKKDL